MIELLSMFGGGIFRLIPYIVEFFKQKQDTEHEYRMAQLQLQVNSAKAQQDISLTQLQAQINADIGELNAQVTAIKSQFNVGVPWVDALSATVRPFLTYYWCIFLYGGSKLVQIVIAINEHAQLLQYVSILITEFDRSVIGSMLAFWFVDRTLRKMSSK